MSENTEYQKQIDWLFHQFPAFQKIGNKAYKPTLDNTLKLIDFFNLDLNKLKFVHVAGTNGKGTTCSIITSVLKESKYKTGLFTSPHIHDFRERIRVNGEMIGQEKVESFIEKVKSINWDIKPSFFEITWVLALKHFIESKCDIVIVETGLGGRLDATNVVTPIVSVITNIGLDHTAILGDTKSKIAREKAGIIKKNTPVFIGEKSPETEPVFREVAKNLNAPIFFQENILGAVFDQNKHLAFSVLNYLSEKGWKISQEAYSNGIVNLCINTGLIGRLQVLSESPLIIADAAHNAEGISALIQYIKQCYAEKDIHVVYGASNDKKIEEIIELFPIEWTYYFTAFRNERSYTKESLREKTKSLQTKKYFFTSPLEAMNKAQISLNKNGMILAFGSFFLLEEII